MGRQARQKPYRQQQMTSSLVHALTHSVFPAYLRQAAVVACSRVFIAGGSPRTKHAGVWGAPPRITCDSAALNARDSYSDQES